MVIRRYFGGESAAQTSPVNNDVLLAILFFQFRINELHIVQHLGFTSFARTFSKATIIHQYHIIPIPVKIGRILCPTFYTSGIAMKIQYKSLGVVAIKMQPVNAYTRLNVKKQFPER